MTRARETGFTLIELMITIAIIAVLAGVAVVAYSRHMRSNRIIEGHEMLGRIMLRQEAYYEANATYCNASQPATTYHPALGGSFEAKPWAPAATWSGLALTVDKGATYFSYATVAGVPPAYGAAGDSGRLALDTTPPSRAWFYAIARADMKQDGTPFTELNVTSQRTSIVVLNQGE